MKNYHPTFEPDKFYHVYNRANSDQDQLFTEHTNYRYFLELLRRHAKGFVKVYAYCLIPNHFHLLIRTESEEKISQTLREKPKWNRRTIDNKKLIISEMFRRFFVAYAKAFNKKYDRRGSLFQKDFKRTLVEDNSYFESLIFYIHTNPLKHLITLDFRSYPYSSYSSYDQLDQSFVAVDEVLTYFEGKEKFERFHQNFLDRNTISIRNSIS